MKLKNIFLIFSIVVLFLGIFYFISFNAQQQHMQSVYTKISVITRESSSDAIVNLQQGLEQAANDMDVEMSILTLTEQNSAEEQQRLIEREINGGAEAIVITPIEDEQVQNAIQKMNEKIPIICMGSTIESADISAVVLGQDEQMGRELGKKIFVKGVFNKKILLLESSTQCDFINKRKMALLSMLENRANSMIRQPFSLCESAIQSLENIIQQEQPDIIIALEPTALDIAAETVQRLSEQNIMVYGFGMTSKTLSYIEKDEITAAIIQNDFNLGYLSIRTAMEVLHKIEEKEEGMIDYAFVNRGNMYTKENQRLLFPFVR